MSLIDDLATVAQLVLTGITNQVLNRSIKKASVAGSLNGIIDVVESALTVGHIPFTESDPLIIPNWNTAYFPDYNNGKFLIQFIGDDGTLQDRLDIQPKRTIDRTGQTLVQTGVSFDSPFHPAGQILIEYSNLPLI